MNRALKNGIIASIVVSVLVCCGIVLAADVVVKEGNLSALSGVSIPNHDFEDGDILWAYDAGWEISQDGGDWKARIQGYNGATIQPASPLAVKVGRIYKVIVDIGGATNDYLEISIGGAPPVEAYQTGTMTFYFLAVDTSNLKFQYDENEAQLKTIDNVTVTEYGSGTVGKLQASVLEGLGCTASGGIGAVALGEQTIASGRGSFAAGYGLPGRGATGDFSVALGYGAKASAPASTAIGSYATASGSGCVALGANTIASGGIAIGNIASASGDFSTAIGNVVTATSSRTTAVGYSTNATAYFATAIGKYSTNNVADTFTVGYGSYGNQKVDFRVESGKATVYGNLYVSGWVDAAFYDTHSVFYDKAKYGNALDYLEDSSKTIKVNAEGEKEYDHERDPVFLKKLVTETDYDKYTDKMVRNEQLQEYEPVRTYETHQELRSNESLKIAWLRQCVFELKQENELLKAEPARVKQAVGME